MQHAGPRSAKKFRLCSGLSDFDSFEVISIQSAQESSNETNVKIKQKNEGVNLTTDPGFRNGLSA